MTKPNKPTFATANKTARVPAIDFARGIALVAMAIFHFGWDLEMFGLARSGMTLEPHWKYFARVIAASFLTLVGVGAWLAHHAELSVKTLKKRIIQVGGAALLITIATYFATPNGFIFFGILHNITVSSLLVLLFLRLSVVITAAMSVLVLTAPFWGRTALFDDPIWWWSGLSAITPQANDYVPIFPWFGWVLAGLVLAKILSALNIWQGLAQFEFNGKIGILLRFFGRNSLVFYLLHQPLMIGLIYLFVKITA